MLERVISDLRERRLWPVAVALLVAIVAVPFVLAKSPAPAPPAAPVAATATAVPASLPSVSVGATSSLSKLTAAPRDPFTPPKPLKAVTATAITSTASIAASASTATASAASAGGATAGAGVSPTTSPVGPSSPTVPASGTQIPAGHSHPAPAGLTSAQTYEVTLATMQPDGGLNTLPPLERLSPVPSLNQPLLVEVGVLEGGRRVLFAVLPGTSFSGPGSCIPGPIDCELLSLAVNQTETVAGQGDPASAATSFAVTSISVADHHSAAAGEQARRTSSARGRQLLAAANLDALSLFSYDPSRGVVVDLRNLSVGGN